MKNKQKIKINPTCRVNTLSYSSFPLNLQSVFIGIMLGDGSLYRSSPTSNVRFEMSFGQKYEAFALHLGELFKYYMLNPVKSLEVKGLNKNYTNYRLKTRSLPIFVHYFNMFYIFNQDLNKHVKIIPQNIIELLDPVVLAYLIQTDGNYDKGRNRVRIYTNSYQKEDVKNLAIAINNKLGIYTGVLHDRNNQWILTIGAKQLNLLRETVSTHFYSSMLYRIGL
jgi:LAGLIDADG DNA endonuclease family protein